MSEQAPIRSDVAAGPRERSSATRPDRLFLRVRVTGIPRGDTVVDLTIPTNLVPMGLRLGARLAPLLDGEALDRLRAMLDARLTGPLLDAHNPAQHEHVAVWIE